MPRPRRQARPRLPQHHDEPVDGRCFRRLALHRQAVQSSSPPARATASPPHWRRADRTRCRHHPDRRSLEARRGALRVAAANRQRLVRPYPGSRLNDKRYGVIVIIMHGTKTTSSATSSRRSPGGSSSAIAEAEEAHQTTIWGRDASRGVRARPAPMRAVETRTHPWTIGEYNFAGHISNACPIGRYWSRRNGSRRYGANERPESFDRIPRAGYRQQGDRVTTSASARPGAPRARTYLSKLASGSNIPHSVPRTAKPVQR